MTEQRDMQKASSRHYSIEYFPPRTEEGEAKLDLAHKRLSSLGPEFFSVTYGAGGTTKKGTRKLVLKYIEAGSDVAPHLSFGGASDSEVLKLLNTYKDAGVSKLVALRGDAPSGFGGKMHHRYANELVEFVRQQTGDHFEIYVACYPEVHPDASSYAEDVAYFKQKVDAGANAAITQYFYNADAYFRFVDYCQSQGIDIPIIPGIMPISNFSNLARFSGKCGAEIPQWLSRRLQGFSEDGGADMRKFGLDVVTELCERLLSGGAPGLHFYSMNTSKTVSQIWNNLSLSEPA
ncbi:MAG: methylenetetrahydrofolate reductase [NAD(P)H] [Pseudomonadales bacterium]|nr:methylenetetrahydrofolate reductase [NAD(P)H] [Pseudomonadales bacterium]